LKIGFYHRPKRASSAFAVPCALCAFGVAYGQFAEGKPQGTRVSRCFRCAKVGFAQFAAGKPQGSTQDPFQLK